MNIGSFLAWANSEISLVFLKSDIGLIWGMIVASLHVHHYSIIMYNLQFILFFGSTVQDKISKESLAE